MSRERRKSNNKNTKASTQSFPIVYWLINIVLIGLVSAAIYFTFDMMDSLELALIVSLSLIVLGIIIHIVLSIAGKQYSKKPFKDKQAGILFTNLLIFIVVTLLGVILSYTLITDKYLNHENIYEGVYVDECDLSNLSYDEAKEVVLEYDKNNMAAISQSVTIDGAQVVYTSDDLGLYSDAESKVTEAFNYGKASSNFQRMKEIFALKSTPKVFNIQYSQNEDYVDFIAETLVNKHTREAIDASYEFTPEINSGFTYVNEQVGAVLSKDDIVEAINNNISAMAFADLSFNTEAVNPTVMLADIKSNTTLIATYTTELEDDPDRTSNVDLASTTIEGIIQPGETFAFNDATGKRTVAAGYKVAHAIADGTELIDSVAGGVCQVASTLYSALLDTDVEIVERYNHSFSVAYMPAGRDATVDYDTNKDFKFTNNTGAPLYISSYVTDNPPDEYGETLNTLTINVYGAAPDAAKQVVCRVEIIDSMGAVWEYEFSDAVKTGSTVVVRARINGKKTETYRDYYENGVLVESVLMSEDTYKSVNGKKIYGSG